MTIEVRDSREPGHFWADNELVDKHLPTIGVHGFAVYMLLARHVNNNTGQAMLSIGGMADRLSISKPTVRKALAALVEYGLITVQGRAVVRGEKGNTVQIPNVYTLLRVKGGGKGDLPPLVNQVYHGGKGDLPGVVKDVDPNKTPVNKTQLTRQTAADQDGGGAALLQELKLSLNTKQITTILATCPDFNRDDLARCQYQIANGMKPGLLIHRLTNGGVRDLPPPPADTAAEKQANLDRLAARASARRAGLETGAPSHA